MLKHNYPPGGVAFAAGALRTWAAAVVECVGTPPDIASDVAEVLVAADLRGIDSHGTARLPPYVNLVESGLVEPAARPRHERVRLAITLFDARNGWGHHSGRVAMDDAIVRCRETGVAAAVVRNSNHYGIAGWYAMRAAERGLIGVSMTNSSPLVAPTRGRIPMVGTNPIAVAAPAGRHGMLVLDMATSTVTRGRIEVAQRRGEALPIGWAVGLDGSPTSMPEAALKGALLPLGGLEETAGYKGYGLALIVDVLTGVLAGAHFGPNVAGLFDTEAPADLGHFFMAIDPDAVTDSSAFQARVERYLDQLTSTPTMPKSPASVIFPGLPEAKCAEQRARLGVPLDRGHYAGLAALADRFGLPLPEPISSGAGSAAP